MKQNKALQVGNSMKVIGITGGVGAGKSELLSYIAGKYNCQVILADEVAHKVKEPGQVCYNRLVELLGEEILQPDGWIDKARMAEMIFASEALLDKVNAIIHPAVQDYIEKIITSERRKKELDFLFVEAALLIEAGYSDIVDELWYIYAEKSVRRARLKASRQYSDEKIDSIMEQQLSDEKFRKHCKVVIDNSNTLKEAYEQIDRKLGESL